jgi:membrane associated rhomboid family serine protease
VEEFLNRIFTTVGASGAIYAILLGFAMSFPNEKMFVFPLPFPIKAKFFVLGYAAIELWLGVANTNDGVAHYAHLGGMLFGLVLILYWRKKHKIGGPYV